MTSFQVTATIRDRGQLTIPDKIRKVASWADTSSVVSISINSPDEIIIRPHQKKEVNWEELWKMIEHSRSLKGKSGSMSEFIARDRANH